MMACSGLRGSWPTTLSHLARLSFHAPNLAERYTLWLVMDWLGFCAGVAPVHFILAHLSFSAPNMGSRCLLWVGDSAKEEEVGVANGSLDRECIQYYTACRRARRRLRVQLFGPRRARTRRTKPNRIEVAPRTITAAPL